MKDRLTTAPLPLERPQGYFVLFVGRRYYLRPIILWNGPQGYWNAPWRLWNARRAILYCSLAGRDKSLYYLRPILLWNAPENCE